MQQCIFCLVALLLAGCYDSAKPPVPITPEAPAVTMSLRELQRLHAGTTVEIAGSIVVSGRVTSDDRAGNFYRTLTLEADGVGVELMAGIDHLGEIYPEGYLLTVNLQGLAVGQSRGVLQIGRAPSPGSGYATDYIGSRATLDRHVVRGQDYKLLQPEIVDIASLQPEMAGRFVRIDELVFAPEDSEEPTTWSGNKRFADVDGNVVYVYTRPYADYADREIPLCEVLLAGILQYERAADGVLRYTLKLRDEDDCWY